MSTLEVADEDVVVPDRSLVAVLGRRVTGRFPIDPWGLDVDAAGVLRTLPGAGGLVRVEGAARLPDGPALLVQRPRGWPGPRLVVAAGVARAADRPVRLTGVPDLGLVIGALRRLGGVTGHPADLRGLLLAGELVAVPFDPAVASGRGHEPLLAALRVGVPVVPVALVDGGPLRRALVRIGRPVPTRRRGAARDVVEVASTVGSAMASLLGG